MPHHARPADGFSLKTQPNFSLVGHGEVLASITPRCSSVQLERLGDSVVVALVVGRVENVISHFEGSIEIGGRNEAGQRVKRDEIM